MSDVALDSADAEVLDQVNDSSWSAYPEYKDSGVSWVDRVPSHWGFASLRWLSKRYAGGTPDKAKFEYWDEGTIPWLNSGAVNDGIITEASAFITQEGFSKSSAKWIPQNSLVMALAGQGKTKGMVALLGFPATCNQSMAAIIPDARMIPRYLYWWLTSNYQNIRNMAGGAQRDGLNLDMLGDIKCPLLPKEEQVAIASFLDRETAHIDALIVKKQQLIDLLQEKRKALISQTVTKGLDPGVQMKGSGVEWLGEIPAHWEVKAIKHIKSRKKHAFVDGPFGSNLKSVHFVVGGDVYVVESEFATKGKLELENQKTITTEHFQTINRSEARGGDIIIAKIGAYFGLNNILPDLDKPAVVSGNSMKLSVNGGKVLTEFIHFMLLHLKWSGAIDLQASVTAQPALSLGGMNCLLVTVPPINEQERIVAFIDEKRGQLDSLVLKNQEMIRTLREYRAAIVSAAVTGKIDVRQGG